jgi:hypothetical protein
MHPFNVTAALNDTIPHLHSCVSQKIYSIFGLDGEIGNGNSNTSDDDDLYSN